jgi:hypothetical protein
MGRKSKIAAAKRKAAQMNAEPYVPQRSEEEETDALVAIFRKLQANMPEVHERTVEQVTCVLWNEVMNSADDASTKKKIDAVFAKAGYTNSNELTSKVMMESSSESEDEQVREEVVLSTWARQNKARKQKAHSKATSVKLQKKSGAEAPERKSSATLGIALTTMQRMPKPRSMQHVDELLWGKSQATAQEQLLTEFKINCEEYYTKMCEVGKVLLAQEIHRRTQAIYDYRASKVFSKNKKQQI